MQKISPLPPRRTDPDTTAATAANKAVDQAAATAYDPTQAALKPVGQTRPSDNIYQVRGHNDLKDCKKKVE